MDVIEITNLALTFMTLTLAVAALYVALKTQRRFKIQQATQPDLTNEDFNVLTTTLSDGSIVWQRLIVQCDELSTMIPGSMLKDAAKTTVSDWLVQLRSFARTSKSGIDQAHHVLVSEAQAMTTHDLAQQLPEMERFSKEMKSNIIVISDQLSHTKSILLGIESLGTRQLKITLHKPQGIPHFLRRKKKIAELKARKVNQVLQQA